MLEKVNAKDFRKFACSDYFNNGRDFRGIFGEIDKLKGNNQSSKDFIKSLSKNLGIGKRTLWNRLYELMNISESYTVHKEIKKDRIKFDKITANYYLISNSYNLFEQKYKANLKAFHKTKKNVDAFQNFYELLQLGGYYSIYTNRSEQYIDNLGEQVVYHSASYMINHYLHLTEMLQQRKITASELALKGLSFITDSSVEVFLNALNEKHNDLYYIVSFHYQIYKAFLTKREDIFYHKAMECFEKVYTVIDDSYKGIFYQILINYCINRTNMNDKHYYNELFELYNRKLKDGLYQDLKVGNFPINNFRDYIFVALQLGKIDWIKWFIEKYSAELPERIRKDETSLSYGIVHYNEGSSEKALDYLNSVAGDNYIHYMDSKYYKMRILYELGQWEEAIMEIDNSKHYIRSHKEIPDAFRKPYKFFITEYSRLLKIRLNYKIDDAAILSRDLKNKPQTFHGKWIIKKLDEIKG